MEELQQCSVKSPSDVLQMSVPLEEADSEAGEMMDDEDGSPGDKPVDTEMRPLLLHEAPEAHCREWLNLFAGVQSSKPRIVDLSPGSGTMAFACCRDLYVYSGVVMLPIHGSVVKDALNLRIVLELVMNKRNGFSQSRFLSRERSLGGGSVTDTVTPAAPDPEKNGDGKEKTATNDKADSGSSVSSESE